MPSRNVLHELWFKITLLRSKKKLLTGVCNVLSFRLCINLMHFTLPVTSEEYGGSHHPKYEKCVTRREFIYVLKLSLIYLV